MIIAIDGPAASGKGTLARRLADHYGLAHLDTGSLYRGVAHRVLLSGGDPADDGDALRAARSLDPEAIDRTAIRSADVGEASSIVAAKPEVRAAILALQRRFAAHPPGNARGAVLDGRDIGTVVCPEADVKFYVTASPEIRAKRRYLELKANGAPLSEEAVLDQVRERDRRDAERTASPMRPAEDAHLLDTSNLAIDAAFREAVAIIERTGAVGS